MLYPYRLVYETRFPVPAVATPISPIAGFLEIVDTLNALFDETPVILRLPGGTALTLLYRDVVYLDRDITDSVGALAARVNLEMPLCFFGTTDTRETAELTLRMDDGAAGEAAARLRSVSGRRAGQLHGLGVHLELPDSQIPEHLSAVVDAMPSRLPMVGVTDRTHDRFLRDCGLLNPTEGSMFAYFSWSPGTGSQQFLHALTAEHKMRLWQVFLEDRQQPVEFDWIWETYYTEHTNCLLEWELALHMVLEKLGFQVERSKNSYRLMDGTGQERRFDFARGGSAEKLFLKLLFPVDAR